MDLTLCPKQDAGRSVGEGGLRKAGGLQRPHVLSQEAVSRARVPGGGPAEGRDLRGVIKHAERSVPISLSFRCCNRLARALAQELFSLRGHRGGAALPSLWLPLRGFASKPVARVVGHGMDACSDAKCVAILLKASRVGLDAFECAW